MEMGGENKKDDMNGMGCACIDDRRPKIFHTRSKCLHGLS